MKEGNLPEDSKEAQEVIALAQQFTMLDGILCRMNPKQGELPQIVVPASLKQQIMEEHHAGVLAGHFSGPRLFKLISRRWWWKGMYKELMDYARNCPQCTIVGRTEQKKIPPLMPIPVDHPFQILGVDVMELPLTAKGNKYLIVFQDLFAKWPMAFPTPDQKTERIARLLAEEIVPLFGVPEALLSDRGTNLLSILMQDVCKLIGIKKLNTTAHHPQCDGMIERLNRTFKAMLQKQDLEENGMFTYQELCGPIATLHTLLQERNHLIYCLAMIAVHQLRLLCYQLVHIKLSTLMVIVRN